MSYSKDFPGAFLYLDRDAATALGDFHAIELPEHERNLIRAVRVAKSTGPVVVRELRELASRIYSMGPNGPQSWSNEQAERLAELVLSMFPEQRCDEKETP